MKSLAIRKPLDGTQGDRPLGDAAEKSMPE
jgi:hypothetical protein